MSRWQTTVGKVLDAPATKGERVIIRVLTPDKNEHIISGLSSFEAWKSIRKDGPVDLYMKNGEWQLSKHQKSTTLPPELQDYSTPQSSTGRHVENVSDRFFKILDEVAQHIGTNHNPESIDFSNVVEISKFIYEQEMYGHEKS